MASRKRLPSTVVAQARRVAQAALREPAATAAPATARAPAPTPSPRERREKIVQALRRLHPMD